MYPFQNCILRYLLITCTKCTTLLNVPVSVFIPPVSALSLIVICILVIKIESDLAPYTRIQGYKLAQFIGIETRS